MTNRPEPTPFTTPWDVATAYVASFGLFAPGLLMAARRVPPPQPSRQSSQG
ncbi:hypothetical protein [Asticcacaulis sp. 201]|uniref:hypothetical protein n=1 Tax=Asticcacaulis sp. 201 TaxID=3028787 RepID=UPI0029166535|nr:hypothetical protein [Asticcacaulis sp. 201]MDV6332165.1 hypothetical protein [Asticcacaulis sp. 201]